MPLRDQDITVTGHGQFRNPPRDDQQTSKMHALSINNFSQLEISINEIQK